MAVAVIMPRQGQSVESCIITKWHKQVGDTVNVGDILFSYETDKASFDEEAKDKGTLLAILIDEGDDVPVLENVAVIGESGEDISGFTSGKAVEQALEEKKTETAPEKQVEAIQATGEVKSGERIKISPRARAAAENRNLDITKAVPTGPDGRIIERDIVELSKRGDASVQTQAPTGMPEAAQDIPQAEYEDVPLTNIRKVIAKSMQASLATMAQLTHSSSFDATEVLAFRAKLKQSSEGLGLANITLNDMVLYAVSRVLKNHRDLNAHFLDDKMRYFSSVNLGMAVDTPRGLLVPTIFGADSMTLNEIAAVSKDIARQAQEGSISPDLLSGATFTISNLGALGVEHFTPVINPPQTGILGVNNIQTRVKMVDGNVAPYQAMGLSLTYDHRALDGAPASRFLHELCKALENFSVLLAK